jgi:hypothetical protein
MKTENKNENSLREKFTVGKIAVFPEIYTTKRIKDPSLRSQLPGGVVGWGQVDIV